MTSAAPRHRRRAPCSTPSSATCPRPIEEPPVEATDDRGETVEVAADPAGPLLAQVFKTTADPFVGRLTYFRVWSGTIKAHDQVWNADPRRGGAHRPGLLHQGQGAGAGRRAPRGRDRRRGQARAHAHRRHPLQPGAAAHAAAHRLPGADAAGGHRARLQGRPRQAQHRPDAPAGGGPHAARRAQHRDRRAAPVGPGREPDRGRRRAAQAQVRDLRRHPCAARPVPRDDPRSQPRSRAATRSRPAAAASSATCGWRSSPTRAAASCSQTQVVGGVVPRQFFPGVEKGVRDVAEKGPIGGLPGHRLQGRLYDGSFHTVDSDELSFRLAGSLATRKGIAEGDPVLLEPIMDVEVRVPEAYMGEVNRDLNTRRGRVLGMDTDGGQQIVRALVPQAELFTYATELRSITGGRGTFSAQLAHVRGGARRTSPRRSSRPTRPKPTRTTEPPGSPASTQGTSRDSRADLGDHGGRGRSSPLPGRGGPHAWITRPCPAAEALSAGAPSGGGVAGRDVAARGSLRHGPVSGRVGGPGSGPHARAVR